MRNIGSFRRLVFHGLVLADTTEIGTAILPLRRPTRFRRLAASLLVAMAPRRVPSAAIPVAFALAVLAVLATTAPEQAAAQTVTTFISNTGQTLASTPISIRATAFTTGTGTYTLSSVAIYLGAQAPSSTPVVQIYTNGTDSLPGTLVANMTQSGHGREQRRQHLHRPGQHHAERQHDLLGGHEQFRRDHWQWVSDHHDLLLDPGQRHGSGMEHRRSALQERQR